MLSNSAGSHNTASNPLRESAGAAAEANRDWIASPPQLVRPRPECLQLALDFGKGARKLLPSRGVRRRFELAAELGERETERFGAAELIGIAIAFRHRAPGPLFLAFVHPFLDSILCVDKAFA